MSCRIGDPITTIMRLRAPSPTAGAILLGVHAWGGNALYMKILAACTHPVPQEIDFTIATIVARQRRSHVDQRSGIGGQRTRVAASRTHRLPPGLTRPGDCQEEKKRKKPAQFFVSAFGAAFLAGAFFGGLWPG